MKLLLACATILALQVSLAWGADPLGKSDRICHFSLASLSTSLVPAEALQLVNANYVLADTIIEDQRAISSTRQVFNWAMETRHACSVAIGYFAGGTVHPEAIRRCDCFAIRMVSAR